MDRRYNSTLRASNGCWTCRLRRKKCDERQPICNVCAVLFITCHYSRDRPEWMDSGPRQAEMSEQLKRQVRENLYLRRAESIVPTTADILNDESILPSLIISPNHGNIEWPDSANSTRQRGADCTLLTEDLRKGITVNRSDTILLMFYLENVFPFLFPFYNPSPLQGGRAWVLEMMISSPVVRQATLCQSSYFFALARGTVHHDAIWETVLTQTKDAFATLRRSLQLIDGSGITGHLHGAVRIMASIMQVQRFEITILSFNNCQAHLNAALALFEQLLDSSEAVPLAGPRESFNDVMNRLGPSSWVLPAESVQVPSAEQAAFRFSSALLILDDIISSTVLQAKPVLYQYYHSLLCDIDGIEAPINFEAVIGCQNWVLIQLGEISVLDAWKQQCKKSGKLDVMQLVRRATIIKDVLESHLARLEINPIPISEDSNGFMRLLTADTTQASQTSVSNSCLITRVWAHAAFIYLSVVVSGWQPASPDVRYHVGRTVELLTRQISPQALLRTMAWPFCIAGCLAEPMQEVCLRGIVEALQPPSVFGTIRKAFEIMESVWLNRDLEDSAGRDLAACFRSQGNLILLV